MSDIKSFHMSDEEFQTAFRAFLEYRKTLSQSRWADSPAVEREIQCIDELSERLSLVFYYPPKRKETAA